jgi:hypothetical protein
MTSDVAHISGATLLSAIARPRGAFPVGVELDVHLVMLLLAIRPLVDLLKGDDVGAHGFTAGERRHPEAGWFRLRVERFDTSRST